jgi:hypothetical protein
LKILAQFLNISLQVGRAKLSMNTSPALPRKTKYMKRSSVYVPGILLASSTILFSCTKTDVTSEGSEVTNKKRADCQVISFRSGTNQYIFQKQIDASGKLQQITAAVYQGGGISSSITLDVHWNSNAVAFLKAGTTTDTVLSASLNAQGKPVNVVAGNTPDAGYLPTSFEYTNSRLSAMKISLAGNLLVSNFSYDDRNNCTLIQDESRSGEIPGRVEYTYDNKKAEQQVYLDEPRPFSWNTFSLMQFSGLFTELQPANLRTAVKVWWANNYKAYDAQLINHDINDGTLVKYDVTFPGSTVTLTNYINVQCGVPGL